MSKSTSKKLCKSSGVSLLFNIFYLWRFNRFVGQNRGYKIFRTGLSEQTPGFLALRKVKFVRILANIAVSVFASRKQHDAK